MVIILINRIITALSLKREHNQFEYCVVVSGYPWGDHHDNL